MFITGVNNTGEKFIAAPVNNLYFPGVLDTIQKKKQKA
jgi:hypothetical protein